MSTPRPMPPVDLDTAAWWDALRAHELRLQRCGSCSRYRWPPRAMCNACTSFDWAWITSPGTGTVASWTVTHHSFGPDVAVPFVVALVRLDDQDDIFVPGFVEGPSDGSHLRIGLPVAAGFADVDAAGDRPLTLIRWRPIG